MNHHNHAAMSVIAIPISEDLLHRLASYQDQISLLKELTCLDTIQIAILTFLNHAHLNQQNPNNFSQEKIVQTIKIIINSINNNRNPFIDSLIKKLTADRINRFSSVANTLKCTLLNEYEISNKVYLNDEDEWDPHCNANYNQRSTYIMDSLLIDGYGRYDHQNILLHVIRSNIDESLCIQGYAGCGKSTLVKILSQILNRKSTFYLGRTHQQISELKPYLGQNIKAFSFYEFIHYL